MQYMKKMLFCYGIGVTTIVAKSIKNIISTITNNNLFIAFTSLKNLIDLSDNIQKETRKSHGIK